MIATWSTHARELIHLTHHHPRRHPMAASQTINIPVTVEWPVPTVYDVEALWNPGELLLTFHLEGCRQTIRLDDAAIATVRAALS